MQQACRALPRRNNGGGFNEAREHRQEAILLAVAARRRRVGAWTAVRTATAPTWSGSACLSIPAASLRHKMVSDVGCVGRVGRVGCVGHAAPGASDSMNERDLDY
jgi:hypothetical protein